MPADTDERPGEPAPASPELETPAPLLAGLTDWRPPVPPSLEASATRDSATLAEGLAREAPERATIAGAVPVPGTLPDRASSATAGSPPCSAVGSVEPGFWFSEIAAAGELPAGGVADIKAD